MNILKRKELSNIEGIKLDVLKNILNGSTNTENVSVDSIIYDKILLDNGIKINCIKNYYAKEDGTEPKNTRKNTCPILHKFYDIRCNPFDCERCHNIMIAKRENREVKRKF